MMIRMRLVAEFPDCVDAAEAERRFDAFREAVQPSQNYGVILYRASTLDTGGCFACVACGNTLNPDESNLCGPCSTAMANDLAQRDRPESSPGSRCSESTCGNCGRCGGE